MTKKQMKKLNRVKMNQKKKNIAKNQVNKKSKIDFRVLEREIYNSAPNMIHENDFISHQCSLCGVEVKTIHDSHNSYPLGKNTTAKEQNGMEDNDRCCTKCNRDVINARLLMRGLAA